MNQHECRAVVILSNGERVECQYPDCPCAAGGEYGTILGTCLIAGIRQTEGWVSGVTPPEEDLVPVGLPSSVTKAI